MSDSDPARRLRRLLDPSRRLAAVLVYTIVAGLICFWRLGATGLMSMEGMVADGARHMVETGEWVVPHVYGEIYTYKPALAYWLASLPMRLGEQPPEGLLRLPFAASGFAMGLAVLLLVGRIAGSRVGLLSALASVGGFLFIQKTRLAEFDLVTAAGVGVAVAAACANLAAKRPRGGLWLLAYLGLAVGFLAKGVPALMAFGPGLLAAGWAVGRFRRLWGWQHVAAAALFVALAGGYLWAAWSSAGAEAFYQPTLEARLRSFGSAGEAGAGPQSAEERSLAARVEGLPEGPLEIIGLAVAKPVLILAALLPWSVLALFALRRRERTERDAADRLALAAGAFLVAGTLTFMAVPTHETRYYLPLAVPVGILAGVAAGRDLMRNDRRARLAWRLCVGLAGFIAVATVLSGLWLFSTPPVSGAGRLAMVVAGSAGGAVLLLVARRAELAERVGLALTVASLCLVVVEYLGVQQHRASSRDLRPQAEELAVHLPAGEAVWVLGPSDAAGKHSSLLFYLGRPVRTFLSDRRLPPGRRYCVLTAQGVDELAGSPHVSFRELGRAEHPSWDYRIGICSRPLAGT